MKKVLLFLFLGLTLSISNLQAQTITEFHYDNTGTDVDEFVEVVVPSDGCTYTIEFYNGSGGAVYATEPVPACTAPTPDICGLAGTSGCIFAVFHAGIQNGAPDGFALIQDCAGTVAVIEFLSYESSPFMATDGAAMGMMSTSVGATESSGTPVGSSIVVTNGVGEVNPIATPGDCPASPLAITLTNFDATSIDGSVMLEWSTENETNNDYFVVEHSLDGRDFADLKIIEGAGTTSEKMTYDFQHDDAAYGMNYYRLTQVDFDGYSSTSSIRAVDVKSTNTVSVYPTVVDQEIRIRLAENLDTKTPINIFNLTGQLVLSNSISANNNVKYIDVANLSSGSYFLTLVIDGEIQTTKFMKL